MKHNLASGTLIDLIYLKKVPDLGDMIYLQSIRSGRMTEDCIVAKGYNNKVNAIYSVQLADIVIKSETKFDAIVRAPSSRRDSVPYYERIQKELKVTDLTDRFSKCGAVRSAEENGTTDDLISAMSYQANGDEGSIRNILIVDDSYASGSTIEAMLHHLYNSGLNDCTVTVAVPALLSSLGNLQG